MNPLVDSLVEMLVKGAAFSLGWLILGSLRPRASAAWHSGWWRAGIIGLHVVSICSLLPALWVVRGAPKAMEVHAPASFMQKSTEHLEILPQAIPSAMPSTRAFNNGAKLMSPAEIVAMIWIAGAGAFLVRLALGLMRCSRLRGSARPVNERDWLGELDQERREQRVTREVALLVCERTRAPFALGLWSPAIILPTAAEQWTASRRRAVLRHEMSHIAEHDLVFLWLAEIARAVHWMNPLAWMLRRRLLLAQERAADDTVLAGGIGAIDYAELLTETAREGRQLTSPSVTAPMARSSTLGRRVSHLLDCTQRRTPAHWTLPIVCFGCALPAATFLGFGTLAAQEGATSSDPGLAAPALPSNWSRTYRDTYRLQKTFAAQFQGTAEEAAAKLQKDLAKAGIVMPEGMKLELTRDKSALMLEYDERQVPSKPGGLADFLIRSGWWDETNTATARRRALEWELAPASEELEKQRKRTEETALEMAKIRQRENIIDPDPEASNAVVSAADRNIVTIEQELNQQRTRVLRVEGAYEQIEKMKPEELQLALRVLQIEDINVRKIFERMQDLQLERVKLTAEGADDSHPQMKGIFAQQAVLERTTADMLAKVVANQVGLLQIEKRTLKEYEARYQDARAAVIEDKQRTAAYIDAKTRYLQAKRVYEAAQIKYSTMLMERSR